MIYYVTTERFTSPIRKMLRGLRDELRGVLRSLTYEELLFERAGPIGHYIFTDFDRLTRYELECTAAFVAALRNVAPDARILNHPLQALERLALLIALHDAGINNFTAMRIDEGRRPTKYPVFIRAEDGYGGPETDILHDAAAYDAALADLVARGLPPKGRIAVGYAAERSADGFFRKYGAFNVAGEIIPYHLMRGSTWVVKRHATESDFAVSLDCQYEQSAPAVAEELAYVRDNPHRDALVRAFAIAGIDYGRADYGIVGGQMQVYEINTNPALSRFGVGDNRTERRLFLRDRFLKGFVALNTPLSANGRVRFVDLRPRPHDVRWPRRRLVQSLARRIIGAALPSGSQDP